MTPEVRSGAAHRYEILDAPADGSFDDVAATAALIFGTPWATVSIVDTDRVWFAATFGLDGLSQIGDEPGLCASAILSDDLYLVPDAAIDPRTLNHPLVRGDLGLRFYAAAPIVTVDGHRLGTVSVLDREPHEPDDAQMAALGRLAATVARQLDLRLAAIHAVRSERVLREEADRRAAEAALLVAGLRVAADERRAQAPLRACELGGRAEPCLERAELKIADAWGDSAWGCVGHVESALIEARGVFLADQNQGVLAGFLDRP